MGDRLTKEIRLQVNAVPGSSIGFDTAIAQLEVIQAKILEIQAQARVPIALNFTSNIGAGLPGQAGVGPTIPQAVAPPIPTATGSGFVQVGQSVQQTAVRIGASFDTMGQAISRTQAQWAESNRILVQNKANLQSLNAQGFRPLNPSITQTSKGVTSISQQFQALDGRIAKVNFTTGKFSAQLRGGTQSVQKFGDTIGSTVGKVALWTVSTGIIFGAVRAISSMKDEIIATDAQMGRLTRVFAGSAEEAGRLGKAAIDLGAALGVVPNQALETAVSVARLQQDRIRTLELLRVALLAQNVAELTVEESLKFTTSAVLQFNLSALQAIQVLNQWNELSNKNRVLTRDLGDAVTIAGKAFFEAGANIQTLNAFTTVLAQTTGKTGAEIGTALRTIAVYAQAVRKAGIVSAITGVEIVGLNESIKPLGQIIAELAVVFDTLTDVQRNNVSQQIAGIRRRTQLLVLLREFPSVITALTQQFEQENSALEEQKVVSGTLQFQIAQLTAEFGKLGVAAGDAGAAGFLRASVTAMRLVISSFNDGNLAGRVLIGAIQVLAARFLILKGASLLASTQLTTLRAVSTAAASSMLSLGSATALAAVAIKGLARVTLVGGALIILTEVLGKLFDAMLQFQDVPEVLDDALLRIQGLANEATKLRDVAQSASDLAGAMRRLNEIEAAGGQLTEKQEELNQKITEFFTAMFQGIRTHREVVQLLETELGIEQLLADLRSQAGTASLDARAEANELIIKQQEKILAIEQELDRRQREGPQQDLPLPLVRVPLPESAQEFEEFTRDDLVTEISKLQKSIDTLREESRLKQEREAAKLAQKISAEEIKQHRKTIRENLREDERVASRRVQFESLFIIDDGDKIQLEIDSIISRLNELSDRGQALGEVGFIDGSKEAAEFEEVTKSVARLGVKLDDLRGKQIVTISTQEIRDELESLQRDFDFETSVIDIISSDALEAAASKYALISEEVRRLQSELMTAAQFELSREEIMSRELRLAELEELSIRSMNSLRLQQLRTMVDMTKELEKQTQSAEKNFLFADRETQARAAALAGELQQRGGERLGAAEFAVLSPDVKRTIADLVPGLLPVEALAQQMQQAMGVATSQIGINKFLQLPVDSRREIEQNLPGLVPTTTPQFQIPEILVPAERFVFPDEIVVTADGGLRIRGVRPSASDRDSLDIGDLSNVLRKFTTDQEGITQKWADIFSQQQQSRTELDVDINFAGVQGPLTNLVTAFTSIVEQGLDDRIRVVVKQLRDATDTAARPRVDAQVVSG